MILSYLSKAYHKPPWKGIAFVSLILIFWALSHWMTLQAWVSIGRAFGLRVCDGTIAIHLVYENADPFAVRIKLISNSEMHMGITQDFAQSDDSQDRSLSFAGFYFAECKTVDNYWWHSPAFPPVDPTKASRTIAIHIRLWLVLATSLIVIIARHMVQRRRHV